MAHSLQLTKSNESNLGMQMKQHWASHAAQKDPHNGWPIHSYKILQVTVSLLAYLFPPLSKFSVLSQAEGQGLFCRGAWTHIEGYNFQSFMAGLAPFVLV